MLPQAPSSSCACLLRLRYSVAAQYREREIPGREEIRQEEELRHRPCIACVKVPRLLQASAGQHSECRQGWGWLDENKEESVLL
ncbi:hypothetical protein FA10DRAFT_18279 [Acaromyces ingoldii]|uniref:Uncharacterized protein n=1 Tax=Acaromyces ingoldii TaxID=215250 RepID=A0A316YVS7_9BASI|nr:hypothetical protein FA10DRAFT_18279 [Acaromyces ingoldii]PWN93291.1 hypothetical protein FA10DRAFT_18279 [Acaromyces ingoldii]